VSKTDYDVRITPSVLDRLLDEDPRAPRDVVPTRAESVRALRRAVQRDLESLLNTRNPLYDLSADFVELSQSVAAYGLPDFSGLNVGSAADQQRLRHLVEAAIRAFEPRLSGVTAALLPTVQSERLLRLRIDARLLMEPAPEPVSFDVVMPYNTCKYEVKDPV
jgi:type VI secretion system protein ImpF